MIKILLAEDDGELCSLVKAYLNASGYEATACRDVCNSLAMSA